MRTLIGITTDVVDPGAHKPLKADCSLAYADAIAAAGAIPILLPPIPAMVASHLGICDGFVFSGGDDPRMEAFGVPTHPAAKPIHPRRQEYEFALLDLLRDRRPGVPVLGVCLGMQMMSLHADGSLDQHLPDTLPTAQQHRGEHAIAPEASGALHLRPGSVWSNHHQAMASPGRLSTIARSPDGVIEAVSDPRRPFYCGVQWHPERTRDPHLGQAIFIQLIDAAAASRHGSQA